MQATANGQRRVEIEASSVAELLGQLRERYPRLYHAISDERGAVASYVDFYVNEEDIRDRQGLETPLRDGDEVLIIPAISGGAGDD